MLIACKCLNVQVESPTEINIEKSDNNVLLQQQQRQPQHQQQTQRIKGDHLQQFFEKALGPLKPVNVQVQHTDLIQEIQIDQWILNVCLCCDHVTHAVRKDNENYLFNSLLLTNEKDIDYLKASEFFSNNFGIILSPNLRNSSLIEDDHSNVELKAKSLNQFYRNIVQNEIEATDERMRRFSEQQFAMLKHFREKAEEEYNVILRLIKTVPESMTNINDGLINSKIPNFETPPATPESTPMSIGNSPVSKHPPELVHPKYSPFNKSKNKPPRHAPISHSPIGSSVDAEFFFDMDGVSGGFGGGGAIASDETPFSSNMSDLDEFDPDDAVDNAEGGISIGRQINRPKSLNIAQSLPVSVPTVNERTSIDDDFDEYDNAEDIAASIKALAKSVHGDAVFGELPRPRFSTQI